MIKHIVMWKLQNKTVTASADERAQELKRQLLALKDLVPSLRKIEVVFNDAAASTDNHDIALITEFDDIAGLKEYVIHPEHIKVGSYVKAVTEARTCIDYAF